MLIKLYFFIKEAALFQLADLHQRQVVLRHRLSVSRGDWLPQHWHQLNIRGTGRGENWFSRPRRKSKKPVDLAKVWKTVLLTSDHRKL